MIGCLALSFVLFPASLAPQETEVYFEVPLAEAIDEMPDLDHDVSWEHAQRFEAMWPYAVLEGEGEALYHVPAGFEEGWEPFRRLGAGSLCVRLPSPREVHGRLYFPDATWSGMVAHPFTLAPERATATRESFLLAEIARYRHLVRRGLPGGAWFRRQLASLRAELELGPEPDHPDGWPWRAVAGNMPETFALFMGGRALSENLQLDRLLPIEAAEEETVALDTLEGIEVRAFDWKPLLAAEPPVLDALAAYVPADQHALFFPSFATFASTRAELERSEAFLGGLDQQGMALASVMDRYHAQLALPWNALVRAFGERAVQSVAITGADPYYPTGTDVAVLFEVREPEALLTLLETLRRSAAPDAVTLEGEVDGVAWRGVETPGRGVSSFAAAHEGVVVVANSHVGLAAALRAGSGAVPRLRDTEEYRFFRQRYELREGRTAALLVIPDAAIRRWCGPRWRVAASRRVRAAAVLADLQAEHMDALVEGRSVRLRPDARFPLGGLQLLSTGVVSSEYGTLAFQTPIAELEFTRIGKQEAELYQRWRDTYQRDWSGYFDPIAVELEVTQDGLSADVTVLPLIDSTDYSTLRSVVGDERLARTDGDPHGAAVAHFVMALDPDSDLVREFGTLASGMLPGAGGDPFAWVGGSLSLYLERDADLAALAEAAEKDVFEDWSRIPLVLRIDVSSGLRLAAFLTAARALVEQTAPGLLDWTEEADGEERFVRVSSEQSELDDVSIYYATTPDAWILSLNRDALLAALRRARAGASAAAGDTEAPAAPTPWEGASAGLFLERDGLAILQALFGSDLRDELERLAWEKLPILNEWRRRYPERDPLELHASLWGERLRCPGGGELRWNEALGTMESTLFGSPTAPGPGVDLPPGLADFLRLSFGLTFEHDGVRARATLTR